MKPTKPLLYITGYGPFLEVTENPSATIAQSVAEQVRQSGEADVHHETLDVNLEAVSKYFNRLNESVTAHLEATHPENRVLLVNVGLHSREKEKVLRLEVRAFNELEGNPIDDELPLSTCKDSAFVKGCKLETTTALIEELNAIERNGSDHHEKPRWIISYDAGRYYCNYALYRGVKMQEALNSRVFAVFLHIVASTVVCMEEQVAQVRMLVSHLLKHMEAVE
ncbi:pyroglutamyl-peptidase I (PGP), putative [Trypanosoma brucei brucei TREU927]|uniref:Pyroglutamyl-peptidase I (PGP), putative n=2 Tax=Trypanosoma brucei TaxID=5691 RepID=D6XFK3_TRYB2|nr:pyroglutamyl-peptidase I (PGP), putative [Trypanosoma brucei brucei TREU927]AAX79024.1 pyroglutamyl-peptidase I (PGP), putative [Trypanosoma brucei]AAX80802.1 hypothetical protein Tb04.4J6.110 [Trypanosoma brucei]AAZ10858.1 pyroglutamyl-peptidase I (PGP), putative [Trypanosoma brucei brucei TREU927]